MMAEACVESGWRFMGPGGPDDSIRPPPASATFAVRDELEREGIAHEVSSRQGLSEM
jgi:hypothetical protein